MLPVTLSFEVHQPHRLRRDGPDEDARSLHDRYFDEEANVHFFNDVAENCYFPATERLLRIAEAFEGTERQFRANFSISTSWLEQARENQPELIRMLDRFPDDSIEFIGQAHYHSLAGLFEDKTEFRTQLNRHSDTIENIFGQRPEVMTNTELIYHNGIGEIAADEGFDAVFTEGAPRILEWRSPNHVYTQPHVRGDDATSILLRNRRLTDDVGYRFSAEWWTEWPLTAGKYASWLSASEGQVVNLFLDYETFGEHHWEGTGILSFLEDLPHKISEREGLRMESVSTAAKNDPVGTFDVFEFNTVSWADKEMDASAWLGNPVQQLIFDMLEDLEHKVKQLDNERFLEVWRKFLTSDHLHHIATKTYDDHSVHNYFSYFDHPHEGFAVIMEHLMDFKEQVDKQLHA